MSASESGSAGQPDVVEPVVTVAHGPRDPASAPDQGTDTPQVVAVPAPPDAGFRIAEVRVQDVRALTDLCIPIGDLTVLVGENNVGKTSFLRSLDLAIGGARVSPDDFHVAANGSRSTEFQVDLRLVPFNQDTDFSEPLAVRFGNAVQLPTSEQQFITLRTRGTLAQGGTDPVVERRFVAGWECERIAAAALAALDRPTRDQMRLLSFFLLDARRDIVEELRQKYSYWGRLLADIGIDAADREAIEAQLGSIGDEVVAKSAVLQTLRGELDRVREALGSAVSAVSIEAIPARIDEIVRAVDVLLQAPNSAALPLRLQGMGSRSLAVVMVFQAFTHLRLGAGQELSPLPVVAFEEPEAHLHPHPQRAMFSLIRELPGQKIISTHSPYVTQVADLFDIRAFTRAGGSVTCRRVRATRADGTAAFDPDGLDKARRFIQKNNGEVLFARCVVLYEGDTEDGAMAVFTRERWGLDATAHGVSLIDAQGAGSFRHFVGVLEDLGIPWVVLIDGDPGGDGGVSAIENQLGRPPTGNEVFRIPASEYLEVSLITAGYQNEMRQAIDTVYGPTALASYKTKNDGQKARGGGLRDYTAAGWEDRLLLDFCLSNMKSAIGGAAIASAIVASVGSGQQAGIPSTIDALLTRVDVVLGMAP